MIIDNEVYDVSSYINSHPGGPIIAQGCGKDSTEMFNTKGGAGGSHSEFAHSLLKKFWVGSLNSRIDSNDTINNAMDNLSIIPSDNIMLPETLQSALSLFDNANIMTYQFILENDGKIYLVSYDNGTLTIKEGDYININNTLPQNLQFVNTTDDCFNLSEIKNHSKKSNCWIIINDNVYDVTNYIPIHPGGESAITPYCGAKDATEAFKTKGGSGNTHSSFAKSALATLKIGKICSNVPLVVEPIIPVIPIIPVNNTVNNTNNVTIPLGVVLNASTVALHNKQSDCFLIINDKVYDVTSYIPIHPGGVSMITSRCGTDATLAFGNKGGNGGTHSSFAQNLLNSYLLGPLVISQTLTMSATITDPSSGMQLASGTTQTTLRVTTNMAATCKWSTSNQQYSSMPNTFSTTGGTTHTTTLTGLSNNQSYTRYVRCIDSNNVAMTSSVSISFSVLAAVVVVPPPSSGYTLADIALHNKQSDCWLLINNKIYDVTNYIPIHPGGITRITNTCGKESSVAFNTRGGSGSHSNSAKQLLAGYYVADYTAPTNNSTGNSTNNSTGGGNGGGSIPTIQEAIQAAYPGATIKEINYEDDGIVVHIIYNGDEMEVTLDENHNII
jgi:cytochrome b involved in lipid metabolism